MATIKNYTSIEQSRKLAEILPTKSADMYYHYTTSVAKSYDEDVPKYIQVFNHFVFFHYDTPCWSLAALINIFKTQIKNSTDISIEFLTTSEGTSLVCCSFLLLDEDIISDSKSIAEEANTDVDACVKIILKLHEQKLL